jgi:RNA polymerase sigma-70 factor (ECF subfamily)
LNEPDPAVVWAARGGDVDAFGELVRAYQADVWRLCLHLLRDRTAADDVTQECFVRAFRFIATYKGRSKFTTWLLSIARNCAVDEMRRSGRRKRVEEEIRDTTTRSPSELVSGIEVREAVAELPMELREPVVLIDMLGLSYLEVAQVLRMPAGTVKSRVHRARTTLARRLADPDIGVTGES